MQKKPDEGNSRPIFTPDMTGWRIPELPHTGQDFQAVGHMQRNGKMNGRIIPSNKNKFYTRTPVSVSKNKFCTKKAYSTQNKHR